MTWVMRLSWLSRTRSAQPFPHSVPRARDVRTRSSRAVAASSAEVSGPYSTAAASSLHSRRVMPNRSEEHTSELQSLMRISYAVFCLKKKKTITHTRDPTHTQTHNHHIR